MLVHVPFIGEYERGRFAPAQLFGRSCFFKRQNALVELPGYSRRYRIHFTLA
jgi:hypothetical protein